MNKYTNTLLSLILVLLVINIAITGALYMKETVLPDAVTDITERLDTGTAKGWGREVVGLYNLQDDQALYALFNDQAKVKISHEQLKTQLNKLYQLFGEIEESAFVSADKIGEKGNELYYKLLFNIRVKETSKRSATLTISVAVNDNVVSLYGVRINAAQSLD